MQAFGEVYDVSGTSFIKTCIEMTTSVKSLKYHDRKLPLIPSSFHRFLQDVYWDMLNMYVFKWTLQESLVLKLRVKPHIVK